MSKVMKELLATVRCCNTVKSVDADADFHPVIDGLH
jgi:hypothetical protein